MSQKWALAPQQMPARCPGGLGLSLPAGEPPSTLPPARVFHSHTSTPHGQRPPSRWSPLLTTVHSCSTGRARWHEPESSLSHSNKGSAVSKDTSVPEAGTAPWGRVGLLCCYHKSVKGPGEKPPQFPSASQPGAATTTASQTCPPASTNSLLLPVDYFKVKLGADGC